MDFYLYLQGTSLEWLSGHLEDHHIDIVVDGFQGRLAFVLIFSECLRACSHGAGWLGKAGWLT